jgi:hypothetical protein
MAKSTEQFEFEMAELEAALSAAQELIHNMAIFIRESQPSWPSGSEGQAKQLLERANEELRERPDLSL